MSGVCPGFSCVCYYIPISVLATFLFFFLCFNVSLWSCAESKIWVNVCTTWRLEWMLHFVYLSCWNKEIAQVSMIVKVRERMRAKTFEVNKLLVLLAFWSLLALWGYLKTRPAPLFAKFPAPLSLMASVKPQNPMDLKTPNTVTGLAKNNSVTEWIQQILLSTDTLFFLLFFLFQVSHQLEQLKTRDSSQMVENFQGQISRCPLNTALPLSTVQGDNKRWFFKGRRKKVISGT